MNGKDAGTEDDDEEEEPVEQKHTIIKPTSGGGGSSRRALALRSSVARRIVMCNDDEMLGDDDDVAEDMSKPTSVINSPRGDDREHRRDIKKEDEDSEDEKDKLDNNVQRLLHTVNANVTRKLLEACSAKNGFSVDKMLGSGGESSCDPMLSPGSAEDSRPHSRYGDEDDDYMDEDPLRSRDDDEIYNNNNSIISNGSPEDLVKGVAPGSHKRQKNGGVEGLAARLELELCQNDAAAAAAFGSKAAASLLLLQQQQQRLHHHDKVTKEMDRKRGKEDMSSDHHSQHQRIDDENHSSQSENELGDHRKWALCYFIIGLFFQPACTKSLLHTKTKDNFVLV